MPHVPKKLRKKVGKKIRKLRNEGKPIKRAIAQGINQTLNEGRKKKRGVILLEM